MDKSSLRIVAVGWKFLYKIGFVVIITPHHNEILPKTRHDSPIAARSVAEMRHHVLWFLVAQWHRVRWYREWLQAGVARPQSIDIKPTKRGMCFPQIDKWLGIDKYGWLSVKCRLY